MLYLAIADSLMNVSVLSERRIVRVHKIWCRFDRRRISCAAGGRFHGTARFGPIAWEQRQTWKIKLLQLNLLACDFEHASCKERNRATGSKNAFSIQEFTTTSWAHSLTIGKLDNELKNASMSWKKWCDEFFDFRFGFYVKKCSRKCKSVADALEDCTFGGFGNKNHVSDWHISWAKKKFSKRLISGQSLLGRLKLAVSNTTSGVFKPWWRSPLYLVLFFSRRYWTLSSPQSSPKSLKIAPIGAILMKTGLLWVAVRANRVFWPAAGDFFFRGTKPVKFFCSSPPHFFHHGGNPPIFFSMGGIPPIWGQPI